MKKQHLQNFKIEDGKVVYQSKTNSGRKMFKSICGQYIDNSIDCSKFKSFKMIKDAHSSEVCQHCVDALDAKKREYKSVVAA